MSQLTSIFPAFDVNRVIVEPWTTYVDSYGWIFLMGFLVAAACGLIGNYIVLRRIALVGDAISHSLLPGIVIAFLVTQSRSGFPVLIGAVIAGIVTTVLIEIISEKSRVKSDAALGITFSTLFALGVILIALYADHVDLDADCVLYGEIAFIPLAETINIQGLNWGPWPVVRMAIVFLLTASLILFYYKELLVTSFDPGLALSLGIPVKRFHYGLMIGLSVVIVSAFEAVGVILVIAMLIFPSVTASLISMRLPTILGLSIVFSAFYSLLGVHLALWLDCSIAGAMAVVALGLFCVVWLGSLLGRALPKKG